MAAHIPDSQVSPKGWPGTARRHMAGFDPATVNFNMEYGASGVTVDQQIRAGVGQQFMPQPLTAPLTANRSGLVSSQYNNLAASSFFQGYTGSGTGQSFSGGTSVHMVNALAKNNNRNMAGAAEPFPAMTYDPYPSPATLYPKVV